jgi:hypothetical protein
MVVGVPSTFFDVPFCGVGSLTTLITGTEASFLLLNIDLKSDPIEKFPLAFLSAAVPVLLACAIPLS